MISRYTTISAALWLQLVQALDSDDPQVRAEARRRMVRRGAPGWDRDWADPEAAERAVSVYEPSPIVPGPPV